MIRLLRSETKRLFARRITVLFPGALMLLALGGTVIAYFVISNDDDNSPDFVNDIAGGAEATDLLSLIAFLIPVMAFVIGASSIGADLKTGMVEQILTWEPRRLRFFAARCFAGFVGVAIAAILVSIVFVGLMFGLAVATGTTAGTTSEFWTNVVVAILRTGLAAGLFAIFGLSVTLLVNSSVGAIVGFVIYFFIIENFLLGAFLPKVAAYLPITNTSAFAAGTDVERVEGSVFVDDVQVVVSHGYEVAGLILAAWTVSAAVVAALVFRRRDVA